MNEGCFSGGGKSERASERGGSELASCMGMTFRGFNGSAATKDMRKVSTYEPNTRTLSRKRTCPVDFEFRSGRYLP